MVVTFTPDATFHDIVATLAEHGISGAPVLGPDGRVLGIISEADVLRKEEFKSPQEDNPPRFETLSGTTNRDRHAQAEDDAQ